MNDSDSPGIPQKRCPACKKWFPTTTEYFRPRKDRKSGIQSKCRECDRIASHKRYIPKQRTKRAPDGFKWCYACKEIKLATAKYFYPHSGCKDGLRKECKDCAKKYRDALADERKAARAATNMIPDGYKQCTKCKDIKLSTSKYFAYERPGKFYPQCKDCLNAYHREYYALKHPSADFIPEGFKRCHKCGEIKPVTSEFFYFSTQSGKPKSPCKVCLEIYRHEHADGQRLYSKQHYQTHKLQKSLSGKAYYETHKEQYRKHRLQYRRDHADLFKQRYQATREYYLANNRTRRARKKAVPGTHTATQIAEQLKRQHYRCYYAACGHAKFKKECGKYIYEIEHTYPLSRVVGTGIPANDMGYIVLACPFCNDRKGTKFPWEWVEGGRLL